MPTWMSNTCPSSSTRLLRKKFISKSKNLNRKEKKNTFESFVCKSCKRIVELSHGGTCVGSKFDFLFNKNKDSNNNLTQTMEKKNLLSTASGKDLVWKILYSDRAQCLRKFFQSFRRDGWKKIAVALSVSAYSSTLKIFFFNN